MSSGTSTNEAIQSEVLETKGPHLPSAYSNLDAARSKHGARADKYVGLLNKADPLADAVVEAFAQMPEEQWRAMLENALNDGIDTIPDAPQSLRAFCERVDHVPF